MRTRVKRCIGGLCVSALGGILAIVSLDTMFWCTMAIEITRSTYQGSTTTVDIDITFGLLKLCIEAASLSECKSFEFKSSKLERLHDVTRGLAILSLIAAFVGFVLSAVWTGKVARRQVSSRSQVRGGVVASGAAGVLTIIGAVVYGAATIHEIHEEFTDLAIDDQDRSVQGLDTDYHSPKVGWSFALHIVSGVCFLVSAALVVASVPKNPENLNTPQPQGVVFHTNQSPPNYMDTQGHSNAGYVPKNPALSPQQAGLPANQAKRSAHNSCPSSVREDI